MYIKRSTLRRWIKEGQIEVNWGDIDTSSWLEIRFTASGKVKTVFVE